MEYHDKVLKCSECSAEFVFTAGEQMFFADKGFKNEPKRCKACKAKRAEGGGGGGGGNSPMRSETKTNCSQCGKETTVPFRPTQGRPVFCRECFQQRRSWGADYSVSVGGDFSGAPPQLIPPSRPRARTATVRRLPMQFGLATARATAKV
jgi:CxxC-x17-CxxC domain-containing protein